MADRTKGENGGYSNQSINHTEQKQTHGNTPPWAYVYSKGEKNSNTGSFCITKGKKNQIGIQATPGQSHPESSFEDI
jgi:hypothetical protein